MGIMKAGQNPYLWVQTKSNIEIQIGNSKSIVELLKGGQNLKRSLHSVDLKADVVSNHSCNNTFIHIKVLL